MLWNLFGKTGESRAGDGLGAATGALPVGHTTVNATTIDEAREVAAAEERAAGRGGTPVAIKQHIWEKRMEGASVEYDGRDVYRDVIAKGALANNIAKRVRASPDDAQTEMQLLEAQVARAESAAQRARAAADEQARKAAAALRQAEAAEAAVEQLERLLARSRARLSQESAAQRRESDGRGVSPGVSPGTRPRQDLTLQEPPQQGAQMRMGATDFKGTFQVSRLPKLVVLELEGGILEADSRTPSPPVQFHAEADGRGTLQDASGVVARLCPGALAVLRTLSQMEEEQACQVAVLTRQDSAVVHHMLSALLLGEGRQAGSSAGCRASSSSIPFVFAYPRLSSSSQLSETLGATMAKSSLDSLRRRTKLKFTDMLYMGPGRRVCLELSQLGVCSQRVPYGVSSEAWAEALALFDQNSRAA
eukprot:Tamp_13797.p1 GENE.Tamp_13797~~Tamp_13797.p1  ORF type:complete len:441 (-),score=105.11 Tamp_13797:361-1620(-)